MATPELRIPRETAEDTPREVAEGRTFTEGETYALVADRVQRETASLQAEKAELDAQIATLKTEKASLQTELDVAVAAKEKAEADFEAYKAEEVEKAAAAERRTARLAQVREVAKHLKDDFFTDERADRWAAMPEAEFAAYVADLAGVSAGVAPSTTATTAETASAHSSMSGAPVEKSSGKDFYDFLGKEN